jgi:hypothetical protein
VQPSSVSPGKAFVPQPIAELQDAFQNKVSLPYPFKARISRKRSDGSSVPYDTHVSCGECGGFYEPFQFRSEDGQIRFKDLRVDLSPDPTSPKVEIGLRLELIAIDLSLCENVGDSLACSQKSEYVHGGQVKGFSAYFNVFSISILKITTEPADTNASMPIFGQAGGNDVYPRVELWASFKNVQIHAPSNFFELEATLYYADARVGSNCLQNEASQSCLGICESNGTLCDRNCPKELGSTGRQFTSFSGDQGKYEDHLKDFDSLYTGMEDNSQACSYQTICKGVLGNATCPNLRINRAGKYYLLFRTPPCGLTPSVPWVRKSDCGSGSSVSVSVESRVFTIRPVAAVPGFLVTTCPKCLQPAVVNVNEVFAYQTVVQLVDPYGNLVENGIFDVSISVPSLKNCTDVKEDQCLPVAGTGNTFSAFYYPSMTDCSCLKGTLKVPVINGYAKFTDLSISTALRQVRFIFYSSNGLHNFSSVPFAVRPLQAVGMRIRQQPLIAQAGERLVFELGVLDKFNFLSELDFETQLHVTLLSPMYAFHFSSMKPE